jgi:hypothetical protein
VCIVPKDHRTDRPRHARYNGELGLAAAAPENVARAEYRCGACGVQPFRLGARFEYPDSLFWGDYEDHRGSEQDLFSWFSLIGECQVCQRKRSVVDLECD